MKKYLPISILTVVAASCSHNDSVEVNVANDLAFDRVGETVELPLGDINGKLQSRYFYVTDSQGNEIPSQITHDSLLVFQATVPAGSAVSYRILPSDTLHSYLAIAVGRLYPERADDIAWENDLVGFRAYGPATQAKGEKAFGYDIFFKHPNAEPVLERLYEPETNPATWVKVDSLRAISPALADEFISSFSYHIDHGLGMDCYAVGPTLGAGVAALVEGDSIVFPWCYKDAQVLDNGPVRFTVAMNFAPAAVGADSAVIEHRILTLDAGSHFNRCRVSYDGLSSDRDIVAGFPRRDESEAIMKAAEGIIAYADPTQGPDNGKALLGVVMPGGFASVAEAENHILGRKPFAPAETLDYYWGFAWNRADVADMSAWEEHLSCKAEALKKPLIVSIR